VGPANKLCSWQPALLSLKYGLGMATAALWVSVPALVAAAEGYGDWVAVNFSLLTAAGLTGGVGGSFKKALDRIVGNSLAIFFVLTVIDVGGVNSTNAIIGIMMPWVLTMLMLRTPDNSYRWTNAAYTYGLAAFEISPGAGWNSAGTEEYVIKRVTMIAVGFCWWIGWEVVFSLVGITYPSGIGAAWRGILDGMAHTERFLATATQTLCAPPADAEARAKAAARLGAERGACEAAAGKAKAAWPNLPFEPDLAGTNYPQPKPRVASLLSNAAYRSPLLVRIEASVSRCRGADAKLLGRLVAPVAKQYAKCNSLYRRRHQSPFEWVAAYAEFGARRSQLAQAYAEQQRALPAFKPYDKGDKAAADAAAADADSAIGVGSAVAALLEVCRLMELDGRSLAIVTGSWALWNDVLPAHDEAAHADA